METTLYNQKGEKAGALTLNEKVWGLKWNADLVHQVLMSMRGNARSGAAHTKFRGEVSGGGKKPWKQKGTGRARHGSTRSPIWRGGGVTHGPRAEKDYGRKINEKMKQKALGILLSQKMRDGEVIFVDSLTSTKTRDAAAAFKNLASVRGFGALNSKIKKTTHVALPEGAGAAYKSIRNLPSVSVDTVMKLNPLDITTRKYLMIVNPETALSVLEKRVIKAK